MALPQREGRPALDIAPDATPDAASWDERYDNLGVNPLNHPVKVRKGPAEVNGWMKELYDTNQTEEVGGKD